MIIRELKIKNFGRFHNKEIPLEEGINLIYGENGSGKSTLYAFIRGMFFGMPRLRGRAAASDTYSRYEPWEAAGDYGGSMRFCVEGRNFFLRRCFYKGSRDNQLYCEDDGEVLSIDNGDLQMLMGGISEVVYDNTVSVGQLKAKTGDGLAAQLRDYMAGYQGSMDGSLNLQQAVTELKSRKKEIEGCLKDAGSRRDESVEQIRSRIIYEKEEIERLKGQEEETVRLLKELMFHKQVPHKEVRKAGKKMNRDKVWAIRCGAAALLLTVIAGMQFFKIHSLIIRGGLALVVVALLASMVRFLRNSRGELPDPAEEGKESQQIRKLQWQQERLAEEVQQKLRQKERLQEEYQEFYRQTQTQYPEEKELAAIELAIRTITELSSGMQKKAGSSLRNRVSEIMRELTEGKYQQVTIEEGFQPGLYQGERYIPLYQASTGTIEQVYFAFRMAAAELLCHDEEMPVILDDAFAMYDEKRLERTLRWLCKNRRQVLIFSCQQREAEVLKRLGISWNKITLDSF